MTMPDRSLLTLAGVAAEPSIATSALDIGEAMAVEPLSRSDERDLATFFDELSPETRRFYSVTRPGREIADECCSAIARYDKLRLVVRRVGGPLRALVEFSFDLTGGDFQRFASYGSALSSHDCRWALCVADSYRRRGLGTALASLSFDLAGRFGRRRMLLWGGTHAENRPAIGFFREVGFQEVGRFTNSAAVPCIDMLRDLSSHELPNTALPSTTRCAHGE